MLVGYPAQGDGFGEENMKQTCYRIEVSQKGCVFSDLRCFVLGYFQLCLSLIGHKLSKAGAVSCAVRGRMEPLFFLLYLVAIAIYIFLLSRSIILQLLPCKVTKG